MIRQGGNMKISNSKLVNQHANPLKWTYGKRLPLALLAIVCLSACGYTDGSELWTTTQCFTPLEDTSYPRRNELYRDTERGCWGQRWTIPEKYSPRMQAKLKNAEKIILYFDVVGVFDPKAAAPPRKARAWENEVQITALTHAGFEEQRALIKKTPLKNFRRIGQSIFGFDIYDDGDKTQFRNVYLFSEKYQNVYAGCLVPTNKNIEDMKPTSICRIYTHINNMFDVVYPLPYSAMDNVLEINGATQNFLQTHMIQK